MKLITAAVLAFATTLASAQNVYLIRHGEKPADGGDGLSPQGQQRAQCLRNVFGKDSPYDIGYIIAEKPQEPKRTRPRDTVAPLAQDLGLDIELSCGKTKADCVKDLVDNYSGPGNILICWEHQVLSEIADSLGAKDQAAYPDDAFNLIWTDPAPYSAVVNITSEDCPGLDSN